MCSHFFLMWPNKPISQNKNPRNDTHPGIFYNIGRPNVGLYCLELNDQHGVTVAEKSVFFLHSFFISLHHQVITSKRSHHDQY